MEVAGCIWKCFEGNVPLTDCFSSEMLQIISSNEQQYFKLTWEKSKYKLLWKICQSKLSSRGKLLKIIIMQTHQQFILVIDQFVISCNLKLQQHFSLKSENLSWITFVVLGHWSMVKVTVIQYSIIIVKKFYWKSLMVEYPLLDKAYNMLDKIKC